MTRRGEGEATFDFGGKTWTLRLDFNAMADFEEQTGKGFLLTLEAMGTGAASANDIRALFWAMLQDHHPELTIREAGRMVTAGMSALNQAAISAMPSAEPEEETATAGKTKAVTAPAA